MVPAPQRRIRPRPARSSPQLEYSDILTLIDPAGPVFLSYTPNGSRLISVGINNVVRVYETGSDAEPTNLDDCQENNTAVAATVNSPIAPK